MQSNLRKAWEKSKVESIAKTTASDALPFRTSTIPYPNTFGQETAAGKSYAVQTSSLADYIHALTECGRNDLLPDYHDFCTRFGFRKPQSELALEPEANDEANTLPFYVFSTPGKAYDGPSQKDSPSWKRYCCYIQLCLWS